MKTAKLFKNGRSQAVRLPKEFRMPGKEVRVYKEGSRVVLEPLETTWDAMTKSLSGFPDDFMEDGRDQPPLQEREPL